MRKEWIGQIRIYLYLRKNYYSFCWINLQEDGSFSFGLLSRTLRFTEWGSAVARSGAFTDHTKILTRGNVDIKDADRPHVTFHPPSVHQVNGFVHMRDNNDNVVDEWQLDWFPVKKAQLLLCAYSGDISILPKEARPKGQHEIAILPSNVQCLRMELILLPRSEQSIKLLHSAGALANIHGICPKYVIACHFYKNNLVNPALYIATDSYIK